MSKGPQRLTYFYSAYTPQHFQESTIHRNSAQSTMRQGSTQRSGIQNAAAASLDKSYLPPFPTRSHEKTKQCHHDSGEGHILGSPAPQGLSPPATAGPSLEDVSPADLPSSNVYQKHAHLSQSHRKHSILCSMIYKNLSMIITADYST